jgi:hypothetical protein
MHVALFVVLAAVPLETEPPLVEVPWAEAPAPVAPRWPGLTLLLTGGQALTAVSAYGGVMAVNYSGINNTLVVHDPAGAEALRATAYVVTGGMAMLLTGMAWLAWTQPSDEPTPKSPAIAAFLAATLELGGGIAMAAGQTDVPPGPLVRQSMIMVISSGVAALAAGVAWLVWASH